MQRKQDFETIQMTIISIHMTLQEDIGRTKQHNMTTKVHGICRQQTIISACEMQLKT